MAPSLRGDTKALLPPRPGPSAATSRKARCRSSASFARSSAFAEISTPCSPDRLMDAPVFLKSNRWLISRCAWLIALSTSCTSIGEVRSNEKVAAIRPS